MIIAVDYDGTLVDSFYPDAGELKEHAKKALEVMREYKHEIIIWTCRMGKALDDAKELLDREKVPYDTINEHIPRLCEQYGNDTRKIYADVYIDDRNLGWDNPSWFEILHRLAKHPKWQ